MNMAISFPAACTVETVNSDDVATIAQIEAWLATCCEATPFHRPAWVMAVAQGTGQEALFLVARGAQGEIVGLLPLNLIHSPIFGRALVSSGFAVDGGIIADDPRVAAMLSDAAVALATARCCTTVELRGGVAPADGWIVKAGAYLNFARPLKATDEEELLGIPKKHRAEVRRGLEQGYRFEVGRGQDLRDIHYRLYCRSVHNLGTPVFPRALFDNVMDSFGEDAEIGAVFGSDGPLSVVISLRHGGAYMPYWHGADLNARKARANEVLYFRLMGHARETGCTIFDFGRSKVGTGPAMWKKTWGFDPEPLAYYMHAAPGHEPRDVNPLSPQYRRKVELWKRLPPVIADGLGPFIARGLG